jgi:hypothetical protein
MPSQLDFSRVGQKSKLAIEAPGLVPKLVVSKTF